MACEISTFIIPDASKCFALSPVKAVRGGCRAVWLTHLFERLVDRHLHLFSPTLSAVHLGCFCLAVEWSGATDDCCLPRKEGRTRRKAEEKSLHRISGAPSRLRMAAHGTQPVTNKEGRKGKRTVQFAGSHCVHASPQFPCFQMLSLFMCICTPHTGMGPLPPHPETWSVIGKFARAWTCKNISFSSHTFVASSLGRPSDVCRLSTHEQHVEMTVGPASPSFSRPGPETAKRWPRTAEKDGW